MTFLERIKNITQKAVEKREEEIKEEVEKNICIVKDLIFRAAQEGNSFFLWDAKQKEERIANCVIEYFQKEGFKVEKEHRFPPTGSSANFSSFIWKISWE